MLELLADATISAGEIGIPPWAKLMGEVSSLGFAVWCAYYLIKHVIPKLNKEHAETIKAITEKHCTTTDKMVEEFREETKEQRAFCQKRADQSVELARTGANALHEVTKAVEKLTDRVDLVCGPTRRKPGTAA